MSKVSEPLPNGLLFVYGETGSEVTETEFNHWYDDEHAPARITVPGFHSALRYKLHGDGKLPKWLAIYDIDSPDTLKTQAYQDLSKNSTAEEKSIISRLEHLHRRRYERLSSWTKSGKGGLEKEIVGKYVLVVTLETTDPDALNKAYEEEHMELLSRVPGWLRARRYQLVDGIHLAGRTPEEVKNKPTAKFLALYDFDNPDIVQTKELQTAITTPVWKAVEKTFTEMDLGIYELHKQF
ncbi:hypothetical protein BDN72DRAFT_884382 [Pluteus cervinus]|uniref:Uncharacterized protein n=1 Tax=Pluteus cervinus TaxID=181527 RepID=A0ACD3BGH7_9AGAR|nr:hypothetical protein BDN72DRAFT_884382 [Pluteus cervinus]